MPSCLESLEKKTKRENVLQEKKIFNICKYRVKTTTILRECFGKKSMGKIDFSCFKICMQNGVFYP